MDLSNVLQVGIGPVAMVTGRVPHRLPSLPSSPSPPLPSLSLSLSLNNLSLPSLICRRRCWRLLLSQN